MSVVHSRSSRHDWDVWRLDLSNFTLVCDWYYIDLESCTTAAEVLDWIAQVSHKTWANPRLMLGLVRALDDVLGLQSTLCSDGRSGCLSAASIRQLALRFADEHPRCLVP
jgi:hypothetical protein